VPPPSSCKSFLAATWALSEGGNRSAAQGGAGPSGVGGARRDRAGLGEAARLGGGGGGRTASSRWGAGCGVERGGGDWGSTAWEPGGTRARGGCGAGAMAPSSPVLLPARGRSTLGALA
jgi:hypothetical protein